GCAIWLRTALFAVMLKRLIRPRERDLIPIRRELDSPGDSQISSAMIEDGNRGGCHGTSYCSADGLHGRRGSRACETSEGCCAGAPATGDRRGARWSLADRGGQDRRGGSADAAGLGDSVQ